MESEWNDKYQLLCNKLRDVLNHLLHNGKWMEWQISIAM